MSDESRKRERPALSKHTDPARGEEPRSLQDAGQMGPEGVASWVEKQIREATERGEFDNLPGAGKPLALADSDDPDWWIRAKMARENLATSDLVPSVIALRREAETYPAALLEFSREDDVRAVLRDYNRRVVEDIKRPTFGPTVPVVAPRIDVEAMVGRWRDLRAERARARASELGEGAASGGVDDPRAPTRRWWQRLLGG